MDESKFMIVEISRTKQDKETKIIFLPKHWLQDNHTMVSDILNPMKFLDDEMHDLMSTSSVNINYKFSSVSFSCCPINDEPITMTGMLSNKETSLSLTKESIDKIFSDLDQERVKKHEYRLWKNDEYCFIEVAIKGFKNSTGHDPTIGIMANGKFINKHLWFPE